MEKVHQNQPFIVSKREATLKEASRGRTESRRNARSTGI